MSGGDPLLRVTLKMYEWSLVKSIGVVRDVDTWSAYHSPVLAAQELGRRKDKC